MRSLSVLGAFFLIFSLGCISLSNEFPSEGIQISDSDVAGTISGHQVWGGTITVVGDVIVAESGILDITPGTKVLFVNPYIPNPRSDGGIEDSVTTRDPTRSAENARSRSQILIMGTMNAVGATFTSGKPEPFYSDWEGIHYEDGGGIFLNNTVEYAQWGLNLDGNSPVQVDGNLVQHMWWGGIHAFNNPNFLFTNNIVRDTGHEAFDLHDSCGTIRGNKIERTSSAFVINSRIKKPEGTCGVIFEDNEVIKPTFLGAIQTNGHATIRNNVFTGGENGILPWTWKNGWQLPTYSGPITHGIEMSDNTWAIIEGNTFIDMEDMQILHYVVWGAEGNFSRTTDEWVEYEIFGHPESITIRDNTLVNSNNLWDPGQEMFSEIYS